VKFIPLPGVHSWWLIQFGKAILCRRLPSEEVLSLERPSKTHRTGLEAVTFSSEDEVRVSYPHDDVLVVTLMIGNYTTHRVLVDNGSSADVLFLSAFEKMKIEQKRIASAPVPLVGFIREKVLPKGTIALPLNYIMNND
jgi:hypothetical protein